MLELPEAVSMAAQITESLKGKVINEVVPLQSPHKFAWFEGDPMDYPRKLIGKTLDSAVSHGGMVEIHFGDTSVILSDGVNIRYLKEESLLPKKHQLLLGFSDDTYLCFSLQMYGGIVCIQNRTYDNEYYMAALNKPSPLSEDFSKEYFLGLMDSLNPTKISVKAFLATEQRIPGLGNGVLQDMLFLARVHPKRKMSSLEDGELMAVYDAVKSLFKKASEEGGRDTEKDLFGQAGRYRTIMSHKTKGNPCPACGRIIEKNSYMGGSIYFCPGCQKL